MKRIIFMAALALSLTACDNTKLQLRAVEPAENAAGTETKKSDTAMLSADTLKKDSVVVH